MFQPRYVLYIGGFKISESIVVQWIIMLALIIAAFVLTRGLKKIPNTKRQVVAEIFVTTIRNLVKETMGVRFVDEVKWMTSYIGTILMFFLCSNLITLLAFHSPTVDLDTTVGWSLITFVMIYVMGIKYRGKAYLKEFLEPTPLMLPLHIIGEISRPISLSFRPFGNILGGMIIMNLLYQLLEYISSFIPNLSIPIGQFLIPVPLHLYFDLFDGALQAFIFVMLTMVFVGCAATEEE